MLICSIMLRATELDHDISFFSVDHRDRYRFVSLSGFCPCECCGILDLVINSDLIDPISCSIVHVHIHRIAFYNCGQRYLCFFFVLLVGLGTV
jgi:hypothetical protein